MNIGTKLPRRGFLRSLGTGAIACAPLLASPVDHSAEQAEPAPSQLDAFIRRYMQAMNAPGLTLAMASKTATVRTAGFGYSNLELKTPVTPDVLFEIGSITKSFVALTVLQLRDEGKVDLQKPILDYLPWLPIQANYGVITVHHLLTHSSGLPDALALFQTDPQARHVQAFKPGEHFHYCNLGFCVLGHLIQSLDRRPWPEAVSRRIFEPLGMTSSRAVISDRTRAQRAQSYIPFFRDATYPRQGRLAPAGDIVFENAAGSITSTPGDMARYLRMLLNRGQGERGRIVSADGFALFSKPYIKAPQFSPTSSYGYGVAIDTLDGHIILRHTGGMVSFASSMHVDLDGGVAAFASINAMQGYRPVPVTQFAVQTMNAAARNQNPPSPPDLPVESIKNAVEYAGSYMAAGRRIEVIASGETLRIQAGETSVPLEHMNGDMFQTTEPGWQRFPIVFARAAGAGTSVVELSHGPDWYVNAAFTGPREFPESPQLKPFTGFFQGESVWSGSVRVVIRKGVLWADGVTPLHPLGDALFRVGNEAFGPDTAQFHFVVDGKAQLLKMNGADLWRVAVD